MFRIQPATPWWKATNENECRVYLHNGGNITLKTVVLGDSSMKTTYDLIDAINAILGNVGRQLVTHYAPIRIGKTYNSYLQVSVVDPNNMRRPGSSRPIYTHRGIFCYKAGEFPKSPKSRLFRDLLAFYLTISNSGSIINDIDSFVKQLKSGETL